MLTATVGWILLIQVVITIIIFLWSYDRYAKRWSTALGRYSVEGAYTRVDYIAGEGASYAGGILSAGVDGIKVAEALAQSLCNPTVRLSV